jgi:hypothetical protein
MVFEGERLTERNALAALKIVKKSEHGGFAVPGEVTMKIEPTTTEHVNPSI